MAKEKHPTWFKLKTDAIDFISAVDAGTLQQALIYALIYLESGQLPDEDLLSPMERMAFAYFRPAVAESWTAYEKRMNALNKSKDT